MRTFNRESFDNENTNGSNNGFTEGTYNLWRIVTLRSLKDVVDTVPDNVTITMEMSPKLNTQVGCLSTTVEPAAG